MPDAQTVALASVLVAGAAAVGAPLATNWAAGRRQKRQLDHDRTLKVLELQHERTLRDVEELRRLMDEGLQKAREAEEAVDAHLHQVQEYAALPEPLARSLRDVSLVLTRMVVRLGREHGATGHYRALHESLEKIVQLKRDARELAEVIDAEEINDTFDQTKARFEAARDAYADAAGPDHATLPTSDHRNSPPLTL